MFLQNLRAKVGARLNGDSEAAGIRALLIDRDGGGDIASLDEVIRHV